MSLQVAQQTAHAEPTGSLTSERKVDVTYLLGSLRDAGAERQALELIRSLDRKKFAVSVILLENVGVHRVRSFVDRCEVVNVPQAGAARWTSRAPSLMRAVRNIAKCLSLWTPDILHAFLPAPSILGGIAGRLAGVPVVIGSRRSLPSFYRANRGFFAAAVDTLAFHLADVTLGNSSAVTEEMKSVGCPKQKCRTIWNGVDTQRFRPEIAPTWRRQMGWTDGEVVLGMIANFRPCKRHCDFLQAAVILSKRHPQLRFVLVGADGGNRADIQNQVKGLGLQDKTCVLESQPDPEKVFAAIDICVCTSETEGFSNVLLEALACGKPVIATRVGGNPEVIVDGENGFLVPVRSPTALADAAEVFILEPSTRTSMGARGRELVESIFSLKRMVWEHEKLYQILISERG